MIKAEIIADSINETGCRCTTFIVNFPRIVLAELNTHRALSKNSASSRAIPFNKMVEMVETNPFIPIRFQKDHKGMQGTEYFEDIDEFNAKTHWLLARDKAVESAKTLNAYGMTKQLCNRILEPFMWHKVIVTATDYENFFRLRAHEDAEIHIQKLAYVMLEEYNQSQPKYLKEGEWHIPFGDNIDRKRVLDTIKSYNDEIGGVGAYETEISEAMRKIAIARCARISYNNFEGSDDYSKDITLCDRLFGSLPRHLSPTEHVAQAKNDSKYYGNFKGFKQFRKFFDDENLSDERVKKNLDNNEL
jgi:thymidylate synthase ThyX